MRRSEATLGWVTEGVSASPTTEQDSDRAKRGWKRSAVPPPLMLFHPFAAVFELEREDGVTFRA